MSCKSFNMCVVLDILDVTCPGVCICPKGSIHLDIWLFGFKCSTSYVEPKFPLTFNETFSFHENFTGASDLKEVQNSLEAKYISIALVQVYKKQQITLAMYKSNVDEVLYPGHNRLSKNGEISFLMKNEPLFPGTISPKITLVTKTCITEQINSISRNTRLSTKYLKTENQPIATKRVHHSKSMNSRRFQETGNRMSLNQIGSTNTDSDTDSQLYCQRAVKTDYTMDSKYHLNQSCKYCKDLNRPKVIWHKEESSDRTNGKIPLESNHNSLANNEYKTTEIKSNKFGKNIKATFAVKTHYHKYCDSKLNKRSSTNESVKTSDEDSLLGEKSKETFENEVHKGTEEEPRKNCPRIKAQINVDVYHCKCGTPNCALNPSW